MTRLFTDPSPSIPRAFATSLIALPNSVNCVVSPLNLSSVGKLLRLSEIPLRLSDNPFVLVDNSDAEVLAFPRLVATPSTAEDFSLRLSNP